MGRWVEERLHEDVRLGLKAKTILYEGETAFQHVAIFENPTFGRVMTLDHIVQTTELDEFIYHEMLTHLPILAHGAVKKVLIIGGGDGGMLEEVLKHRGVEEVTMVEIDGEVVELAKIHLRSICKEAFEDPRTRLKIADGIEFIANSEETFDLIIVDSSDPVGPGEALFTEGFYAGCKRRLRPGGILATQNGVPFLQDAELSASVAAFKKHFADAGCYLATVPTYAGGPMAFGWASDDPGHRAVDVETLRTRYEEAGIETRYYRPEIHHGAFALPGYIAELITN